MSDEGDAVGLLWAIMDFYCPDASDLKWLRI